MDLKNESDEKASFKAKLEEAQIQLKLSEVF